MLLLMLSTVNEVIDVEIIVVVIVVVVDVVVKIFPYATIPHESRF